MCNTAEGEVSFLPAAVSPATVSAAVPAASTAVFGVCTLAFTLSSALRALSAPATALFFPHVEALPADKHGGQEDTKEDKGDEEDEEDKGNEERFDFAEATLAGLEVASGVAPGRAALQQRLNWLGEQLEQRLLERAHTQYLHDPELLHPQHFGIFKRQSPRYPPSLETSLRLIKKRCISRVEHWR